MLKKLLYCVLLVGHIIVVCSHDMALLSTQDCLEVVLYQNSQDIDKALIQAVLLNRVDVVQILLEKDPNVVDEALSLAQQLKYTEIEKVILTWKITCKKREIVFGVRILLGGCALAVGAWQWYKSFKADAEYYIITDIMNNIHDLKDAEIVNQLKKIDGNVYKKYVKDKIQLKHKHDVKNLLKFQVVEPEFYQQLFTYVESCYDAEMNQILIDAGALPRTISLDKAIEVIDSLPDKKTLFMKHQAWKEVVMASQFRYQDWIAILMGHEKQLSEMSQTEAAMQKLKHDKPRLLQAYCDNKNITDIAPLVGYYGSLEKLSQQVSEFEHNMNKKGYIPFVHGRKADWDFVNDIWNMILAVKKNKTMISNDFCFRQRPDDCDVAQLQRYRKDLKEQGAGQFVATGLVKDSRDSELIFCNRTLLANINTEHADGLCSAAYYFDNRSISDWRGKDAALQHLLTVVRREDFSEFESEIIQLYELHKKAQNRGQIVCIGISKNKVSHIMFRAQDGGHKAENKCRLNAKDKNDFTQLSTNVIETMNLFDKQVREYGNGYVEDFKQGDIQQFYCAAVLGIPGEGDDVCQVLTITDWKLKEREEYLKQYNQLFEKMKRERLQKRYTDTKGNEVERKFCFS